MSVPPPSAVPVPWDAESRARLGPYRLIERLGCGAFAPVWLAEEVHDGCTLREVAIKLFTMPGDIVPASMDAERWRAAIVDEARALCRVEHPNVVRCYTLQRDDARGVAGLVMELARGESLQERLQTGGRLPVREVVEAGIDLAWALAAVHAVGLVHRDVKPANVVRGPRGHKLVDFGIVVPFAEALRSRAAPLAGWNEPYFERTASPNSATVEESSPSFAGPFPLAGTPGYVAPECLVPGGPSGSPSADLYALGVTLFKLAAGMRPDEHRHDSPTRAMATGAHPGSAVRLDALLDASTPGLTALSDVVASLLAPDPGARARHADRVARELERVRADLLPTSPEASSACPRAAALAALDLPAPAVLAPLFARAREAELADAARSFGELGLGVVRYAVATGLARLASMPTACATPALAEALREARPTPGSWCHLGRALVETLRSLDGPSAAPFAFLADEGLSAAIDALLRGDGDHDRLEKSGLQLDRLLISARDLLSSTSIDGRAIALDPWLPILAGRLLLPEAPRDPGQQWRAMDPVSGARSDAPLLDAVVRRLLHHEPEAPRSVALRRPPLIGRDAEMIAIDRLTAEASSGRVRFALLTGPHGIGRTRLLDAAVERTGAARLLRLACSPERRSPLRPLIRALAALPQRDAEALRQITDAVERALTPGALSGSDSAGDALEGVEDALLWASADELLVIAVDDVQWGDPHTLALLRLLVERAAGSAAGHLLVLVAAQDQPNPGAALRKLRGAVSGAIRSGIKHVALEPLGADDVRRLARAIAPITPALEDAVIRGAGGAPFLVLHALAAWREAGAIAWRNGLLGPVDADALSDVPGVSDLLGARVDAYFDPASSAGKSALRTLALVALHGGGLRAEVLLPLGGSDVGATEEALEALVDAGILAASGHGPEYGFAQEMVRQAALNLVHRRPWLSRLHRALLDAVAEGPGAARDAAFLADGYEKLGASGPARRFRRLAMIVATDAGLFHEAAEHGDRLVAATEGADEHAALTLETIAVLVNGRLFEAARRRLDLLTTAPGTVNDVRRRILALQIVNGRGEPGDDVRDPRADDPTLLADVDRLAEAALACEARLALAGVAPTKVALGLLDEAVERAEAVGPALELTARVRRFDLSYGTSHCDLALAERDLTRALALAPRVAPLWEQIHLEGSLIVVEAELGRLASAIERGRRLIALTEARGMRGYVRLYLLNLAAHLLRAGEHAEAASVAARTHRLAEDAGDPLLQASSLSIRAAALRHTGPLDEALRCANEAAALQSARGDRLLALTLLRRAEVFEASSRPADARRDAASARDVAARHGDENLALGARIWELLHAARSGSPDLTALERTLDEAARSGVLLRGFSRGMIDQATALLAASLR